MSTVTPARNPLSVLVVDDEPDAAASTAEVLALAGFRVAAATSGADALRAAADDPPDVALLDLWMPKMDGYELARRLRGATPRRLLLIAVTGVADDDARERSAAAGFDLYLVKPVEPDELAGVLARFHLAQ